MPRGLHPLSYLSSFFDVVEINATFYRPAGADHAARWVRLVEGKKAFTFTVKLWQRFTHERDTPPTAQESDLFKSGIAPLIEAKRLGGLLIQFPWSFKNEAANRGWLERILDLFGDYPLALEVRHASWNEPEIFELLRSRRVAICNIDQPLFRRSVAPADHVTARIGYVRLHGQNHANWFRENAGRDARYDYLYEEDELVPWVEKIERMRRLTERLYVITNNHFKGKAAANGLQLAHLIHGRKVKVPDPLLKAYPGLARIREERDPGGQRKLPGF
jgi:uncharacterized protein YecE (DUF72 family)